MFKSRGIIWAGHVAHVEQKKNVYRVLVGKREGKKELASQRYRLEDNEIVLIEVRWEGVDWIGVA